MRCIPKGYGGSNPPGRAKQTMHCSSNGKILSRLLGNKSSNLLRCTNNKWVVSSNRTLINTSNQ